MPWESLKKSLSRKPLVLAGPMLRKVTPHSVTVWIAMQAPATVTLTVVDDQNTLVMTGELETVAIGLNLHIAAVTAHPLPGKGNLKEGIVYEYDLTFLLSNSTKTLAGVTDNAKLAYAPFKRPSFALPPADQNSLRLLQGSCRMPHGGGKDTMPMIDDLIAETATNAFARPHQLLLTGDQIYADDVSDALLMVLIDASDALLDWQEVIPGISDSRFSPPIPACLRYTNLGFPGKGPGFRSEDLQSHLMSLGEYLSMYLFVWSEVLWPDVLPTFDEVAAEVYKIIPRDQLWPYESYVKLERKKIQNNTQSVAEFSQTLWKVRRALANIPTYMIFDDHEVTDDWNITRDFCRSVYSHPLGLRIVQNALTAYALCQHWGNAPEQFEAPSQPGRALLDLFDPPMSRPPGAPRDFTNFAAKYDQNSTTIRKLLGVQDESTLKQRPDNALFHDPNSLQYHFTIEGAGHQVIITDTRTLRSFPNGGSEAPHLLPKDQFKQQNLNTPSPGDKALLVVVTTNAPPVPQDRLKDEYDWLITSAIYDTWLLPSVPFDRLLATLTGKLPEIGGERHGRVILLSGDSHWSFASRLSYRAKERFEDTQPRRATAVFAQLVASSFRKQGNHSLGFHREGYEYAPYIVGSKSRTNNFVGWNLGPGSQRVVGNKHYIGEMGGMVTLPFTTKSPTIKYPEDEPAGPILILSSEPDYRYRLDYLLPTQQQIQVNVPPIRIPAGATPAQRKQAAKDYKSAIQIYRIYNLTNEAKIVGLNNFGEITFDWGVGDNKKVIHTLRWWEHGSSLMRLTTYEVSLNPADPRFPDIPVEVKP